MGGRIRASLDRETWHRWGAAVVEMSDRLGWDPRVLWRYFSEFALMCQYELRIAREVAEDSAWRLLRGCVDKLEVANETDGWCM